MLRIPCILIGELSVGNGVAEQVEWTAETTNRTHKREWVNAGCAYAGKGGKCTPPNIHRTCATTEDCECFVQPGSSVVQVGKYSNVQCMALLLDNA